MEEGGEGGVKAAVALRRELRGGVHSRLSTHLLYHPPHTNHVKQGCWEGFCGAGQGSAGFGSQAINGLYRARRFENNVENSHGP